MSRFFLCQWGNPQHSGSALDCRSTGQAIDPAPGAWVIPTFISVSQVPLPSYSAEWWPNTPFLSCHVTSAAMLGNATGASGIDVRMGLLQEPHGGEKRPQSAAFDGTMLGYSFCDTNILLIMMLLWHNYWFLMITVNLHSIRHLSMPCQRKLMIW